MGTALNTIQKPALLSVDDAKALTVEQTTELFLRHLNPGQYYFLKLLGLNQVLIDRADGCTTP